MKVGTNIHHVIGNAEAVTKVKEQRSRSRRGQMHFSGGGIHFDGMKPKLTCSYNRNLYERASDSRLMLDSVCVFFFLLLLLNHFPIEKRSN